MFTHAFLDIIICDFAQGWTANNTLWRFKAIHNLQYRKNVPFLLQFRSFDVFILGAVQAKLWVNALLVLKK